MNATFNVIKFVVLELGLKTCDMQARPMWSAYNAKVKCKQDSESRKIKLQKIGIKLLVFAKLAEELVAAGNCTENEQLWEILASLQHFSLFSLFWQTKYEMSWC